MGYRYETHLHTAEGSACSSTPGAEMARLNKEAGYTGIFVTDHFFNGNTAVPGNLPWAERVNRYCLGYEHAKEAGDQIGLQVFFGLEINTCGAEFLIYNLDKQWLLNHEDIDKMDMRQALALMHRDGAFIVQAHPFRERNYIDHIQLFPRDVDAVEAINAAHLGEEGKKMNERALTYARMFDLPVTAGSDSHHAHSLFGGGVELPRPLADAGEYGDFVRSGNLILLPGENEL